MSIELNNIFFRQNEEAKEYRDIFLETNKGVLKVYITSLDFVDVDDLGLIDRLKEIDVLKEKSGKLNIEEIRRTYDGNCIC